MRILLITKNSVSWSGCFLFAFNALPCRGEPLYYFLDSIWSRFPVSQFFLDFASAREFPLSHFPSTLFWSLFPSNSLFFLFSFEMLFVLCVD